MNISSFILVPRVSTERIPALAQILLGEIYSWVRYRKTFVYDLAWCAKRLGISERHARRVVAVLEDRGLIYETASSKNGTKNYSINPVIVENEIRFYVTGSDKESNCGKDVEKEDNQLEQQAESAVGTDPAIYKLNNIQDIINNPYKLIPDYKYQPVSYSNLSVRSYNYKPMENSHTSPKIEGEFAEMVERNLLKPDEFEHKNAFIMAGRRPMKRWPDLWLTPHEMHAVFEFLSDHLVQARWSSVFHMAQAEAVTQKLKGKDTSTINAFKYITTFAMQAAQDASLKAQLVKKHGRSL